MDLSDIAVLAAGGGRGAIDAVSGGGSAVSVPVLTEHLGVAAANGTNRMAVAHAGSTVAYARAGEIPYRRVLPLVPLAAAAAVAGSAAAVSSPPALLRYLLAAGMLASGAAVLFSPRRGAGPQRRAALWAGTAAASFWNGLAVVGAGVALLAVLSRWGGLDLRSANAAKGVLGMAGILPSLAAFAVAGQVNVRAGALLAAGALAGSAAAAALTLRYGDAVIRAASVAAALGGSAVMVWPGG